MACRRDYQFLPKEEFEMAFSKIKKPIVKEKVRNILFGVDAQFSSDDLLQNNIDQFEWVLRNKIYPNFYGRNLNGDNRLTLSEIEYLHKKGCKIAAIYQTTDDQMTEAQGKACAKAVSEQASKLRIPTGTAIFLNIDEEKPLSREFLRGYAKYLIVDGYTPGFRASTDAKYDFDRIFSQGVRMNNQIFEKCLIWATTPTDPNYYRMTTSHLIHPDEWKPYAPSAIRRNEIAIWQYGYCCHPIENDHGEVVTFNLDLVRNEQVIMEKMF